MTLQEYLASVKARAEKEYNPSAIVHTDIQILLAMIEKLREQRDASYCVACGEDEGQPDKDDAELTTLIEAGGGDD